MENTITLDKTKLIKAFVLMMAAVATADEGGRGMTREMLDEGLETLSKEDINIEEMIDDFSSDFDEWKNEENEKDEEEPNYEFLAEAEAESVNEKVDE